MLANRALPPGFRLGRKIGFFSAFARSWEFLLKVGIIPRIMQTSPSVSNLPKIVVTGFLVAIASLAHGALVVNPGISITHNLRVQPIIVQQAAGQGGDLATFFGSASEKGEIEGFVDTIWAQAGIDVTFLAATTYVSSFAYNGFPADYTSATRPTVDLSTIVSGGPVHADPTVLNMFFVEIVPGFTYTTLNTSNGLAFIDGNGVAMFVGGNLLSFGLGREAIASVVAHEIGHNLGLDHLMQAENLLQSGGSPNPGQRINAGQISTIFTDNPGADGFNLLVPVPEPSVGLLGLLAVGAICASRRRRH